MQRSFIRHVVFLPFTVRCSLPSIIQYVFQNSRFLHNMQCVIDILYCCQKGAMIMHIENSLKEMFVLKEHAAFYSFKQEAIFLQRKHN